MSLCVSPLTTCSSSLNISLEVGKTQPFLATARSTLNGIEGVSFTYQSSNPAVLTIGNNGNACGGTWDSLTLPQICTPGPTGTAQITATAQGVSSPPVTVYVHQHVTSITISKVPTQPPTLSTTCLSKGAPTGPESWFYEAFAFNGTTDITPSVGPFSWQVVNPSGSASIVNVSAPPIGAPLNQQIATASVPGQAQIFASASGLNSQPVPIQTCLVQSISISAAGNPPANTSFVVNTGTSTTLDATVTDSLGMTLTGVPLTWNTSNPVSVGASGAPSTVFGGVGTASSPSAGGGAVIASCTPPTCNGGIKPSLPIYPQSAISFAVHSNSAPANPTVYASTTACATANPTNATCNTTIVPITKSSSTSTFAAGSPVVLPFSPNSIVYDSSGANAYLGVDSSNFGQKGLMIFSGTSVSQFTGAPGKVLAVSPDRSLTVISDTVDSPNQVFICNNCSASSRSASAFLITGATAAAFSPDSLKAYIVAGTNLYVFSKLDALKTIPLCSSNSGVPPCLNGQVNDVTFFPEGAFAYVAGGAASPAATVWTTCNTTLADTVSTTATPSMIRALPDATTLLALDPPNIDLVRTSLSAASGCPPTITDSITSSPLGQGTFIPTQFIVSSDGSEAYILGETQVGPPPSRFPFIIVFNISTQTSAVISLTGNATPLSASLSPAGNLLFVGADDGAVHVIDTSSRSDVQQVTFPFPTNELCFGPGNPATQVPITCNPDLVAVKP